MSNSTDYSNDVRRFVDAMIYKLNRNKHKGRWEDLDVESAFKRMREEVDELEQAIKDGNTVEILLEGADVANFALILSSIAIDKGMKNAK